MHKQFRHSETPLSFREKWQSSQIPSSPVPAKDQPYLQAILRITVSGLLWCRPFLHTHRSAFWLLAFCYYIFFHLFKHTVLFLLGKSLSYCFSGVSAENKIRYIKITFKQLRRKQLSREKKLFKKVFVFQEGETKKYCVLERRNGCCKENVHVFRRFKKSF